MTQSMTGFASCILKQEKYQIDIEIKSVNNRFFSFTFRSNGGLERFEESIRNIVQEEIARGSLSVFLKIKNTATNNALTVNETLGNSLVAQMKETATKLKIPETITLDTLVRIPGFITEIEKENSEEQEEELRDAIHTVTKKALRDLIVMRRNEGQRLLQKILSSLEEVSSIEEQLRVIQKKSEKELTEEFTQKLNKLIATASTEIQFEPKDILKEASLLAEKADIEEEISRIRSHITETKKTITNVGQIGKKLDFLCQEFGREFNTICSKTKKIEISQLGIKGKLEIEKIREQVQNLE